MSKKGGRRSKWLWGCGITCAVLLVLVIVACVGWYLWVWRAYQSWMIEELRQQYPTWTESGIIPAAHRAAFEELSAAAQDPNASLAKTMACYGTLYRTLGHGALSQYDIDMAEDAAKYVREHPSFGWSDYQNFLVTFPEVGQQLDKLKTGYFSPGGGQPQQGQPK